MMKTRELSWLKLCLLASLASYSVMGYAANTQDTDGDGIPDQAEVLLGTDPIVTDTDNDGKNDMKDDNPLQVANPISPTGKSGGPVLESGKLEDNFDPVTKKDVADHLELIVNNPGDAELTGLKVYISIKDDEKGSTEQYFRNLAGFKMPAKSLSVLHFDVGGELDASAVGSHSHYRFNENSSYFRSEASKTMDIQIASGDFSPSSLSLHKDKGGAEKAD